MRKKKILIDASTVALYYVNSRENGIARTTRELIQTLDTFDNLPFDIELFSQNMKGIGAKINQNAVSSPCMTPCSSLIQSRSLGLCERISLNWLGNAGQNLKPFYWR